jgi:chromosome segregation ATPase
MNIGLFFLLLCVASASLLSQTPEAPPASSEASEAHPAGVASTSTSAIVPGLDRLQNVASQAAIEIGALHIEKWKANSAAKSAAQEDADSVQRNLTSALPRLIDGVRGAPEDVNAEFKLYRNLNALYDVFSTVTEATRVFGEKSQYEALSQQLQVIGSTRRKLGESLEQLTATTQNQIKQMRTQIKAQQEQLADAQTATEDARKQLVLARGELAKKAAPKKKTVAKKPAAAGVPNSNSPGSNPNGQTGTGATTPKS